MYESFLITFRESLEIALIVGIILAYLKRTHKTKYNNTVYLGITAGMVISGLMAYIIAIFFETFTEANQETFEGVIMLIAAILLTSMIFWFFRQQSSIKGNLEKKVQNFWDRWSTIGLFLVVLLSVLREGVETVLFMSAVFLKSSSDTLQIAFSGFAGIFLALIIGYVIFIIGKKVNLRYFFIGSNILLILFAAGLISHGLHELEEAKIISPIIEHVYDINHLINEKSTFGSILKGLFGYNGNPSLVEIIAYFTYLAFIGISFKMLNGKNRDHSLKKL